MSIWTATQGQGADLVVLHGWGMNANIWTTLLPLLTPHWRVTVVDLPGFGDSQQTILADNLTDNIEPLLATLPKQFHLLGWSLGGLIATEMALQAPERVLSLGTIASSPQFVEQDGWPGIKPALLAQFSAQLDDDFTKTIERFLAVQAMGSPHAKQQIKQVRQWIFDKPMANVSSLHNGLHLLQTVDLRDTLSQVKAPFHRLYGRLDSLVPVKVVEAVDALAPQSTSAIFQQCAHAPFLSASDAFCDYLLRTIGTD